MLSSAFRMVRPTLTFAVFGAVACASVAPAIAQDFQKDIVPFLNKYCYDCHDAELAKGHLNLEAFKDDSRFFRDQRVWREVVNQVTSGEMPPAEAEQPKPADRERFLAAADGWLSDAIRDRQLRLGRVEGRRLTRRETERSLHALLGIDFHQTTADRCITLEPVYCLGNCACSPAIRIDDDVHGRVDARTLAVLLDELRSQVVEVR